MRILYVISELTYGGAQKQLVELARELARRGHEVTIYTLNADVPRLSELAGSGVEVRVDQKRSKLDWALLGRLRAFIRERRPDIVHGFLFDGDFYARVAAALTGVPVLNSERSHNYSLRWAQKIPHWVTRGLASGVVANSHAGKAFAERLFGFSGTRVHVVWNGLQLAAVDQVAQQSQGSVKDELFGNPSVKVACHVGAIKPAKDHLLALDVAAELLRLDDDWRVIFVGDSLKTSGGYSGNANTDTGGYKADVMAKYQRLGLADKVKFIGLRTDVLDIIRQCDVLFSTSAHEGFPNVVLEAMAVGTPVASTEYSDIRRILPLPAQVVSERSGPAMAQAICAASAQRAHIVLQQRSWVEQHATIEIAAASLAEIYTRYAGEGLRIGASAT